MSTFSSYITLGELLLDAEHVSEVHNSKRKMEQGKKKNMEAAKMHLGGRHCAAQQDTQRKTYRKMNTKQ